MLRKKRGIALFSQVVLWVFGIFTLVIIIFILFYPGQLWDSVRNAMVSFGYGKLPGERGPEYQGPPLISTELESYFDDLVKKFRNLPSKNNCLVPIKKIPDTRNQQLTLSKNKVKIEKIEDEGTTLPFKEETINGFSPCIVNTKNFYDAYLGAKDNNNKAKFIESDLKITDNKIKYKGTDYSYNQKYLFKTNGHACFFLVHDTGVTWYKPWEMITKFGCDAKENTLDDDCSAKIQNLITENKMSVCG